MTDWRAAVRQAQEWIAEDIRLPGVRMTVESGQTVLAALDARLAEQSVALRVNDGNLFVYGNNEATKLVQDALWERDALRARVAELEKVNGGLRLGRNAVLDRLEKRLALADRLAEAAYAHLQRPLDLDLLYAAKAAVRAYQAPPEGRDG